MSFNKISKIDGLDSLGNLKVLYLSGKPYQKIEGLHNLTSLKVLSLDLINISIIEGLGNLKNIRELFFLHDDHFHSIFYRCGEINDDGYVHNLRGFIEFTSNIK